MNGFEKYQQLARELLAARDAGELLDETEAYFVQALCDCRPHMTEAEEQEAEKFMEELFGGASPSLLSKATDAVRLADEALAKAVDAFESLHDAELALSKVSRGAERDIANRGWARADVSLAVLRMLGTE
jgi:hypothetical protein